VETLALMADVALPHAAVREQAAGALDVVVHMARAGDGSRRLVAVSEVVRVAAGAATREIYALRSGRPCWRAALSEPTAARLAAALAGGHSIRGAIGEAARAGGVPGPAGAALRAVAAELELGERTDVALERLRRDAGGARAYDTIVAAISLQRRAGGDLARLL